MPLDLNQHRQESRMHRRFLLVGIITTVLAIVSLAVAYTGQAPGAVGPDGDIWSPT